MSICCAFAVTLLHMEYAVAHHAEVTFDHSRVLSVIGTIKEFLLANPHTLIYLEVTDSSGKTDLAGFQGGSAIVMTRNGWSRNSLMVGDKIHIDYYPRRDQKPGGMLITATRENGEKLTWRPLS
jgi:diphthamide biosynthesis methyltransferase